ncbi:hypothetical protein PAAG_04097 [Paracoccidioides lutzii Pb01]|uniref:Uncharacterized protein n=1 Tax=Paracoccidioides lutzii (strain ATCC MYA-826 / Pb01) TaxID=502779 RepID=C1H003_PARBA|nr:hypothetical protein PAAG_04097 [Paracoccidioides lutzii Pb01]EEH33044.2 hypothetical protein PAAG_04097 [Paracoccidioides lutzii Pb01]
MAAGLQTATILGKIYLPTEYADLERVIVRRRLEQETLHKGRWTRKCNNISENHYTGYRIRGNSSSLGGFQPRYDA